MTDVKVLGEDLTLQQEVDEYNSMKHIYQYVVRFIARHKLIAYGGSALNEILSVKEKIYRITERADYDCFCINALQILKRLARELFRHGIKYIHVRRALHDGTFTLVANFIPVLDCTSVPKALYYRMLAMSKSDYSAISSRLRFTPAPLAFLKCSMHYEMGKPKSSGWRWDKVYSRLSLLNNQPVLALKKRMASLSRTELYEESNEKMHACVEHLLKYAKAQKLPIAGNYAWMSWLKVDLPERTLIHPEMGFMDILSATAGETAKAIKKLLEEHFPKLNIKVIFFKDPISYLSGDELQTEPTLLPSMYEIRVMMNGESRKLVNIYDTVHECISYVTQNGHRIITPDSLLRYLYANMIIKNEYANLYESAALTIEQMMQTLNSKYRFAKECFGIEQSLMQIKMNSWDSKLKMVVFIPE